MEALLKNIGSLVEDIQIIPHPTKESEFGIRIVFKCSNCKEQYHIDEYDNAVCGKLLESIRNNKPNRNCFCVKCHNYVN